MSTKDHELLVQRIVTVEERLAGYDEGISKILVTLQKIQDALLGPNFGASSGLMEDIRQLKKDRDEMIKVQTELLKELQSFKERHSTGKKIVIPKDWQARIWMGIGGAAVFWFFFGDKIKAAFLNILKAAGNP